MSSVLPFIDFRQYSPVNLRAAYALAVSILLHGMLLLLFIEQGARLVDIPAHRGLTVMLPMKPLAFVAQDERETSQSAEVTSTRPRTLDRSNSQQADTDNVSASQPSQSLSSESETTTLPHIDIDAAYGIARQAARSSRSASASVRMEAALPLEQETQLSRSVSKAARPDCRTAHAGLGLFALPFLIADSITNRDRGCKW